MVKPYVYAACEKVIVAQDGVPSLIGLFNKMIVKASTGAPEVPPNAVSPKEWAIFSSWDIEEGDELKDYIVCTQIFYPDKSPFGDVARSKLMMEKGKRSQVNTAVPVFPVGQVGPYAVRTWVEENGTMVFGPLEFTIGLEFSVENPTSLTI